MNKNKILSARLRKIHMADTVQAMRPPRNFDTRTDVYCRYCNMPISSMQDVVSRRTSRSRLAYYHESCARLVNIV